MNEVVWGDILSNSLFPNIGIWCCVVPGTINIKKSIYYELTVMCLLSTLPCTPVGVYLVSVQFDATAALLPVLIDRLGTRTNLDRENPCKYHTRTPTYVILILGVCITIMFTGGVHVVRQCMYIQHGSREWFNESVSSADFFILYWQLRVSWCVAPSLTRMDL
jgi:hypothetical protein